MFQSLIHAFRATIVLALFTGIIFPVAVTGVSQLIFSPQANGCLVHDHLNRIVGSKLIGQKFTGAKYFHPRPSAAEYDGTASSGTNLGPTSYRLILGEKENRRSNTKPFIGAAELASAYRQENSLPPQQKVPVDAVTRSASGLDPHISLENARYQAHRVARARAVPINRVVNMLSEHTEGRLFGFLGEPRVNVLLLNLALDENNS